MSQLKHILAQIEAAREHTVHAASGVSLVAVSKGHDAAKIETVLREGHYLFGENRVQEAQNKWPALIKAYPPVSLHLIGPLQTNKLADAISLFDVIETLDRPKLARALAKMPWTQSRLKECYIQVNMAAEPQKTGILPTDLDSFVALCCDELALPVTGLMCIPPHDADPTPYFDTLRDMAQRHSLPHISMGMSGDYEKAIACGATHVRIGTALFGKRE